MATLEIVNFVVDVALVLSLVYFSLRFIRSSGQQAPSVPAVTPDLENTLRELIHEAEHASRSLDAQLMKRQSKLEQTLFDLEVAETRVQQALTRVDQVESTPAPRQSRFRDSIADLDRDFDHQGQDTPEPASFREPSYRSTPAPQPKPTLEKIVEPEQTDREWENVNIFGEPIGTLPSGRSSQPLSRQIEKESQSAPVVAPAQVEQRSQQSLEKIYRAAELMLRAGKDLQTIATRTRLPLEEIHALSQKVAESSGAQVNSTPRISRRPDIHRETQLV